MCYRFTCPTKSTKQGARPREWHEKSCSDFTVCLSSAKLPWIPSVLLLFLLLLLSSTLVKSHYQQILTGNLVWAKHWTYKGERDKVPALPWFICLMGETAKEYIYAYLIGNYGMGHDRTAYSSEEQNTETGGRVWWPLVKLESRETSLSRYHVWSQCKL